MTPAPRQTRVRGENRVVFLAAAKEVRALLETGKTMRSVWVEVGLDRSMGYWQFRHYVGRFMPEAASVQRYRVKTASQTTPPPLGKPVIMAHHEESWDPPQSAPNIPEPPRSPIMAPRAVLLAQPPAGDVGPLNTTPKGPADDGASERKRISRGSSYGGSIYNLGRPASEVLRERHGARPAESDK